MTHLIGGGGGGTFTLIIMLCTVFGVDLAMDVRLKCLMYVLIKVYYH